MAHNIEVFYTGGGITLAEAPIDRERYAVVSSEAPEFLAVYKRAEDEDAYLAEDMLLSAKKEDLPLDLYELHTVMVEKLKAF